MLVKQTILSDRDWHPILQFSNFYNLPNCSQGHETARNNASINSKREHPPPPPGKPPGNFPAKARPPRQKTPTFGEYVRRASQPFLLTGVEILGFCRNQTLKRIGRLSNYSLVIPSSFSLSTILKSFKVPPSFETDFVTREER